jgi:predicted ATPase
MEPSILEELRLKAFKSFRDAVLPLTELTLLVGRNGSGKSNALDGLWALAQLAGGEDVRDALDGGREGPAVRGGVAACPPLGDTAFTLGCRVRTGTQRVELDVTVQAQPHVQIVWERLRIRDRDLLVTDPPRSGSSDISARWDNRKQGPNPILPFRASRLLTTQIASRVPSTAAGQRLHAAAEQVLAALRSVFVLDPVPHQMRQYVPRRDALLRRNAENLSAAVGALMKDAHARARICQALGELNEQDVVNVATSRSELDDLMITLVERFGGAERQIPARIMSDGTLRFLAILTALLQAPAADDPSEGSVGANALGQTTVVIEELENGLHASQAGMLVALVREEVRHRRVRVLATAHSPALMDALAGEEHPNVVICERGRDGVSQLVPLVELPGYVDVIARGGLGRAVVEDRLHASNDSEQRTSSVLDTLFEANAS